MRLLRTLGVILGVFVAVIVYATVTHQPILPPLPSFFVSHVTRTESEQRIVVPHEVPSTASTSTVKTNATVVHVVDGDTIDVILDGETEKMRIRFLGINTPETVDPRKPVQCFGKEASAHMHALLDGGKRVRLDEDPQADNIDKYGRLLRNVIAEDGTDINAAMVRDGYAYSYLFFPLTPARKAELKKLENDARLSQRGLWSPATCSGKL